MRAVDVLLIEDNPGDVLIVRETLSESGTPVHLTVVEDGEQARHLVSRADCAPDLMILGLNLPTANGHEVLEQFRKDHASPVVVFTCSEDYAKVHRAYQLGANAYFKKSTDLATFINVINGIAQQWIELLANARTRAVPLIRLIADCARARKGTSRALRS